MKKVEIQGLGLESVGMSAWGDGNRMGRVRAAKAIERIRATGDVTLLLSEARRIKDPLYGPVGVGFFNYLAAVLAE